MVGQFHSAKIVAEALTFDDVLLVPRRATIHPREIDVSTQLTRGQKGVRNLFPRSGAAGARKKVPDTVFVKGTQPCGHSSLLNWSRGYAGR